MGSWLGRSLMYVNAVHHRGVILCIPLERPGLGTNVAGIRIEMPRRRVMIESSTERAFILFFRLAMAWTFLYSASHQIFVPDWSVAGFLSHTKTFHDVYAPFTAPSVAPALTFLVGYGHLLIGLSLAV